MGRPIHLGMSEIAPKLGELLLQAGLIDSFQLQSALGDQRRWGGRLGEALVRLGFVDEFTMARALSRRLGIPTIRLADKRPAPDVIERMPRELAEKHRCLPLFVKPGPGGARTLYVGIDDPGDLGVLDELSFRVGMSVRPVIASSNELREAIERVYGAMPNGGSFAHDLTDTPLAPEDTAPVIDADHLVQPDAPLFSAFAPGVSSPLASTPGIDDTTAPSAPTTSGTVQPPVRAGGEAVQPHERPREVPTRDILRALTHLLIEKGVLTRDELISHLRASGTQEKS